VSTGDTEIKTPGLLDPGVRGRRRVSTGVLSLMQNMSLSEEPEDVDDTKEVAEEEMIDDEDLPVWAKRSTFVDDRLGVFCFDDLTLYRTHLLVQVVHMPFYPISSPQIFNLP